MLFRRIVLVMDLKKRTSLRQIDTNLEVSRKDNHLGNSLLQLEAKRLTREVMKRVSRIRIALTKKVCISNKKHLKSKDMES
jgi:hypothetical protein